MTNIKRYDIIAEVPNMSISAHTIPIEDQDGEWVLYEDIKHLLKNNRKVTNIDVGNMSQEECERRLKELLKLHHQT